MKLPDIATSCAANWPLTQHPPRRFHSRVASCPYYTAPTQMSLPVSLLLAHHCLRQLAPSSRFSALGKLRSSSSFAAAMAFGISKALVAPLMVLNFILYLISAAIAGSLLNKAFDHRLTFGNAATEIFLIFVLIASMVGLASVLAGAHHLRVWRTESLAAAAATALIAWLLTLLAMGVAAKQIHIRSGRNKRLKALEAFIIILSLLELLYLLALHAGNVTRDGYANAPGARNVKDPNYGTPAATAV